MSADPTPRAHPLVGVDSTPGVAKPDPVLVVDGVRKAFGGLTAVDVHHLEVERNTITALIGPNGAGKTTFFNLLTGFDQPDHGTKRFDGEIVDRTPPHRLARMGMVRTFQLTKALAKMTVLDNMMLGAPDQRGESLFSAWLPPLWRAQETRVEERARVLLERFLLADKASDYAGTLSGGQRKLLEMARALMVDPAVVLLDEPMAGVNPALVESLLGHVTGLRDEGRTVLFVEHDMDVVMGISDWVVCMAEGSIIFEGLPRQVAEDDAVVDAYLGRRRGEGAA